MNKNLQKKISIKNKRADSLMFDNNFYTSNFIKQTKKILKTPAEMAKSNKTLFIEKKSKKDILY